MSVDTGTPFQRARQEENLSFSHWTHIFPEICSLIKPCSFWALAKEVFQQEGTREACHHVFKDHLGQIKVHHLRLIPEFSDCSVLGFTTVSSSGLSPLSLVICLATLVMRFYDFAKSKAARLKFSVLYFSPRVLLFGELGNWHFKLLFQS